MFKTDFHNICRSTEKGDIERNVKSILLEEKRDNLSPPAACEDQQLKMYSAGPVITDKRQETIDEIDNFVKLVSFIVHPRYGKMVGSFGGALQ